MTGSYDAVLVGLSIAVAILASYAALDLARSVAVDRGRARTVGIAAGAVAMGLGIWSMHFVGMLAFSMRGMAIGYDVPLAALSVAFAVAAAAVSLIVVTRVGVTRAALIGAAHAMGAAIVGMHYIGMWSMRMPASIAWNPALVAASVVIAVVASYVALWLAFRFRLDRSRRAAGIRIAGAVVMGLAIAGMHYTAMAAARFLPGPGGPPMDSSDVLATHELGLTIAVATLLILLVTVIGGAVSRALGRHQEQSTRFAAMNEELTIAEERLRGIINSSLDAMVATDAGSVIIEWNRNAERIFGWTSEEAIGRSLAETIIPAEYRVRHAEGVQRYLETGIGPILNQRIEITALHRNGHEFPIELAIAPIRSGPHVMFTSFIRDITELKRAQERQREGDRREQLLRAMEDERTRLSAFFHQAPAFIALLEGPDHIVALRNQRYVELFGRRAITGKPMREALPGLVTQGYGELLDKVFASGEPHVAASTRFLLEPVDGEGPEEIFVNIVHQPFRDAEGRVAGIFVHGVDVSDLVRARQEAEAASRAKSDFLSRMSHELRTPLNAILGFGQLLELDVEKAQNRESVDQILRAGKHLLGLIDEVLDIARIESGQISFSVGPVPIRTVVQESLDLVRLMAEARDICIEARDALRADGCVVAADHQRLKQVVLNLLSNAVKYNRPRGTVTVTCEEGKAQRLRLVVEDTGYGIPPERLDRLFTPFERLGAADTAIEGTGLGLALSRGLVTAMGGTLGVESTVGTGSRFWIELPMAVVDEPPPARPTAPVRDVPADGRTTSHTVLVVEDNPANVRLMQRIFQLRPHVHLLTALTGGEGLELARRHRPDVVILDLNLPDLGGDEVLAELRRDPVLAAIPVMMISGDAIPSQVQRLLDLGANAYLTKPFDLQELLRMVDEWLSTGTTQQP